jgi:hypothetical protein
MPDQTRTTKKRAQRIDLSYIGRLFPIRRRQRLLSFGLIAAGLIWLGWYALTGNFSPYSAGPIHSSHASFGNKCGSCHTSNALFSKRTSNQACSGCHDGPVHQAQQIRTPDCAPCHREHTGTRDLTRTSDHWCTQCHSNLQNRSGVLKVSANITSFGDSHHPEFAAVRSGARDPRTIEFNHAKHLKKDLRALVFTDCTTKAEVRYVQLSCSDCHRASVADDSWTYGRKVDHPMPAPGPKAHARQSNRAYMAPVNYYEHCSRCHPLCFDLNLPAAPHGQQPVDLQAWVVKAYDNYSATPQPVMTLISGQQIATRPPAIPPRTEAERTQQQISTAKTLLWGKLCKDCHSVSLPTGAKLPVVAKPSFTSVWLPNANFDHEAHQMVKCDSCHADARTAADSYKVLIPSIKVCQQCHRPGDKATATGSCFECHVYHDWSKEKRVDGKYDIHQLISRTNSTHTIAATPAVIAAIRK